MADPKTLKQTTAEVWEFLGVAIEHGALPPLEEIDIMRRWREDFWTVKGYLGPVFGSTDIAEAIAAVRAYAAYGHAAVKMDGPCDSFAHASDKTMRVSTQLQLGAHRLEVVALLDGDEYAAAIAADTQTAQVAA